MWRSKDNLQASKIAEPSEIDFDFEAWFLDPKQPKPNYYFEDGLRKVKPYYYVYEANAKGRWFGRKILEIFTKEFQDQSPSYYERAINAGYIRLNKKIVNTETLVKNGDVIHHLIHRHEPPVSDEPISIVSRSDE
ncbi:DRAP deaminase, partial [Massospora cicadina]